MADFSTMSEEQMLDDKPSRYDNPLISPGPEVMHLHFSLLSAVNGIVMIVSFLLILGILRSKKVRSNAFHLYLLFMAIPDFIAALLCFVTCMMNASQSSYYSEWMCQFQSFYLTTTYAANTWINAVIVHEVYKLIRFSHGRRRYFPPTRRQVFLRVSIVYAYGIFWGLMASVVPGLPVKPAPFYGLVCIPMEYDLSSTIFFYMAYVPGIMVLPLMYSLGVMIHILRRGLLPKSGKNRVISVYLLRLIALYFCFWVPCLVLKVMGNFFKVDPWIPWAGSFLGHFQGLFSSLCAISTSDAIRHEVFMVLRCNFYGDSSPMDQGRERVVSRPCSTVSVLELSLPKQKKNGKKACSALKSDCTMTISGSIRHEEFHSGEEIEAVDEEEKAPDLEVGDGEEEEESRRKTSSMVNMSGMVVQDQAAEEQQH